MTNGGCCRTGYLIYENEICYDCSNQCGYFMFEDTCMQCDPDLPPKTGPDCHGFTCTVNDLDLKFFGDLTNCFDCFHLALADKITKEDIDLVEKKIQPDKLMKKLKLQTSRFEELKIQSVIISATNSTLFDVKFENTLKRKQEVTLTTKNSILQVQKGSAFIIPESSNVKPAEPLPYTGFEDWVRATGAAIGNTFSFMEPLVILISLILTTAGIERTGVLFTFI